MLNRYKFLIALGLFGLVSCETLEQEPLDRNNSENFWHSQAEVEYAVSGLYNGWEVGTQIFYMDCVSDNSMSDFPWEGFQALGNGTASPTNSGNAESRYSYTLIRKANWILENIDKAPIADDLKDRFKGEVRTLRAYKYLDLAILFGGVPLITKTVDKDEALVEASTREAIFAFVDKELREAAAQLPPKNTSGRMSKASALGFLARSLAFQKKHQEVANVTKEIIDLGAYSLFSDYAGLFEIANESNSEVISEIQYIAKEQGYTSLGIMMPNSMGGWSSIVPIQSLVDDYETKNGKTIKEDAAYSAAKPFVDRDPRFAATIVYPGAKYNGVIFDPLDPKSNNFPSGPDNASSTAYNYRKYLQNPSSYDNVWNVGVNIIVQRYAEILLLNAEANIELNKIDESVYANINAVRRRAKMPEVDRSVYAGQAKMRELVRRELRIELAGEGRRHFDITRWNIAKDVLKGPVYGSLSKGTVNPTTGEVTFTSLTDRFFVENRVFQVGKNELWPIPQSVIDRSKGTLKPNPGY